MLGLLQRHCEWPARSLLAHHLEGLRVKAHAASFLGPLGEGRERRLQYVAPYVACYGCRLEFHSLG